MVHALKPLCTLLVENPLEEQFTSNVDKLLLRSPPQKREPHDLVTTISQAGNKSSLCRPLDDCAKLSDPGLRYQS